MTAIISQEYVKKVCQPGTEGCCSYLGAGTNGFECLKESSLKAEIDKRRTAKSMRAMGDNCKGYLQETSEEKIHLSAADGNWANKLCKCADCGVIERCTIEFDFYTIANAEELVNSTTKEGFQCESCMMKELGNSTNQ